MGEEKAARMNITVPAALKARMDAVGGGVNWSAVAARAFEAEVRSHEALKEGATMDDVFARLEASEEGCDQEDLIEGKKAGRAWACKDASASELRRLARFMDTTAGGNDWDWSGGDASGIAHTVLTAMTPGDRPSRQDSEEFWESALGDRYPEGPLLQGFCEGAVSVWQDFQAHRRGH
jgi:hypothetical protein